MSEFTLRIDGMHCGSCVRRVSQALAQTAGVTVKEVQIGAARIDSDQETVVEQAIASLERAGYTAHPEATGTEAHAGH